MDCIFLGHQSWLISEGETNLLVDPVLYENFGYNDKEGIEIFPPRSIDFKKMPKIDAIFLSHEHEDHFHLPTLMQFPNTPVFFGPLMYQFIEDILQEVKIQTYRIPFETPHKVKDIEVILFHAHQETVLWEGRVSQLYIRSKNKPCSSVFIAVDALVSDNFKSAINNETLTLPDLICVSNNSQITPPGVLGTLDNQRNPEALQKKGAHGLRILSELLIDYLEDVSCKNIVICGGGFTKKYESFFGSYPFSDQKELAFLGQQLVEDKNIFGPWPGDVIHLQDGIVSEKVPISWVHIDYKRLEEISEASQRFQKEHPINALKPQTTDIALSKQHIVLEKLQKELLEFGRYFLSSPAGEASVQKLFITSRTVYALAFVFYQGNEPPLCYGLNINTAQFDLITNQKECEHIPSGVECFLEDFCHMLQGGLTIWDLVGVSMRAWYPGKSKLTSPIVSLYHWYGEVCRPDLSHKSFKKRWSEFFLQKENNA